MIVLDASAAVDLVSGTVAPDHALALRVGTAPEVHVPELFELELLSALRGLERGGRIGSRRLSLALARSEAMRSVRWPHAELRNRIWELRHRLSVYDAVYAALAKLLDLPLVTTDARLAAGAGPGVAVELYE